MLLTGGLIVWLDICLILFNSYSDFIQILVDWLLYTLLLHLILLVQFKFILVVQKLRLRSQLFYTVLGLNISFSTFLGHAPHACWELVFCNVYVWISFTWFYFIFFIHSNLLGLLISFGTVNFFALQTF